LLLSLASSSLCPVSPQALCWPNLEGPFGAAPVAKGMTMFALPLHDDLGELTVVASYAERLADGRLLIVFQLTARSGMHIANGSRWPTVLLLKPSSS
jgi:hypothetical protein